MAMAKVFNIQFPRATYIKAGTTNQEIQQGEQFIDFINNGFSEKIMWWDLLKM